MEIGHHLGRKYVVEDFIGRGAFATVFACKQSGKHVPLAAKVISIQGDRKLQWEGENEIEVLKDLQYHPHIVTLQAVLRAPTSLTLILERMPNVPLFHGIVRWPGFQETDARIVMKQMLEALNYCHSQRIVHRDLSSVNILWQQHPSIDSPSTQPWLRIIDFNLARRIPAGRDQILSDALGHTLYAAPESLGETPIFSYATDVWAIGVILFLMLVGYPPFWNDNYNFLLRNIEEANFEIPSKYWKDVSEEGRSLVSAMLALKIEDRITTQKALRHRWLTKRQRIPSKVATLTETQARLAVFVERTKEISGSNVTSTVMKLKHGTKRVAYVPDEELLARSKSLLEQSSESGL